MATLNTNAANLYKAGFEYLLTQTASKFRPLVTVEHFGNAEEFHMNQIAGTTVSTVADLTADSVYASTSTSRRQITKSNYYRNELVTDRQLNDMNFDPKSDLVQRIMSAYGAAMDSAIITAATGDAKTGKAGGTTTSFPAGNTIAHGSAGLTYAKALEAIEFFLGKDYESADPLSWVIGAKQVTELLNIDKFIDNDFSRLQKTGINTPMTSGYIGTLNLGIPVNVFVSSKLAVATSIRSTLLFSKRGIGLGIGKEVEVQIAKNPSKNMQTQITTGAIFGASRLDEDQVLEIECSEA